MRLLPPITLALGLLSLLIFLFFPRGAPPIAHAQSVAVATITSTHTSTTTTAAAAAAHSLYLPLIHKHGNIKRKSGLHLGNRGLDWRIELFSHITGTVTGTWPAAVVVLSDQIFHLSRPSTPTNESCRVTTATVKRAGEGEVYNAFKYLTAATKAGTKVVIRISPSPGNFLDYVNPGDNHRLRLDIGPAGGNYCDESAEGGPSTSDKIHAYRDILDIAQEMRAIYTLVVDRYGWPATSLFFEPANEPNQEWYQGIIDAGKADSLIPNVDNKEAWIDMDNYFAALYTQAKVLNPELQVLLPSMAQGLYGEHYMLGTCDPIEVVGDGLKRSGLDLMKKSFGYDIGVEPPQITEPKADGFAWHNYWREGRETWLPPFGLPQSPPTVDDYCAINDDYEPPTDHLYQYLSAGMQLNMSALPTFITEADLLSPCQLEAFADTSRKDDAAAETRDSLVRFIEEEYQQGYGARYVIAWLLVNQYEDEETSCQNAAGENNHNYEINWHEAYPETGDAYQWFQLWWPETP